CRSHRLYYFVSHIHSIFFTILPRPPRSPLFPYTTLFRSRLQRDLGRRPPDRHGDRHGRQGDRRAAESARDALHGGLPSPLRRERSEEHTSELQSLAYLVCRLLLEKKKKKTLLPSKTITHL